MSSESNEGTTRHDLGSPLEIDGPTRLGDFEIIEEIGRGAMGVVYAAQQISLKRRVALKVMRFLASTDEDAYLRFQREAEVVAQLHHTNIVPIFAFGSERGISYYAMDLIDGESLDRTTREGKNLPSERDLLRWGLEGADALQHAHERGVIHRDLKPSNLLLDRQGRLWLTDFGLAKRFDDVTLSQSGSVVGSPLYMSPEQATVTEHAVGPRSDVYGLGATLFHLATGRPIFDYEHPHRILEALANEDPVSPRKLRSDLSRDFETVLLRCLAKSPERRYESAGALGDDLRAILDGRPIRARRESLGERVGRWYRRKKHTVSVAVTSSVVMAVLGLSLWLTTEVVREARSGRVHLDADRRGIVAEVLDEEGREVVAPFPLPAPSPLTLPRGTYEVRLSVPRQLSESVRLPVVARREHEYKVQLEERELWPKPLQITRTFDLLEMGTRAHVVELSPDGVIFREGKDGAPKWTRSWVDVGEVDRVAAERTWSWGAGQLSSAHRQPFVVDPAPDLDGDGLADVVVAFRHRTTLAAFSSVDGFLLWAFETASDGAVLSVDLADADDDGTVDLVVTAGGRAEGPDDPNISTWIEVISGYDGSLLWRHRFENALFDVSLGSAEIPDCSWHQGRPFLITRKSVSYIGGTSFVRSLDRRRTEGFIIPYPARVLDEENSKTVFCSTATSWHRFDLSDGEILSTGSMSDRVPLREPLIHDLDGDGDLDVLSLHFRNHERLDLLAHDLDSGQRLWATSLEAAWANNHDWFDPTPLWPLIAEEDDGGAVTIMVADRESQFRDWGGIRCLDGASGQGIWFRPMRTPNGQIDRFVLGPDIDQDGRGEVFVAELQAIGTDGLDLFVDALSGRTGEGLWWQRETLDDSRSNWQGHGLGALQWWPRGGSAPPTLIVPYLPSLRSRGSALYVFEPRDGRLRHRGLDLRSPSVADMDGDGLDELLVFETLNPEDPDGGGWLTAFAGRPPEAWRSFGFVATKSPDLDGDGTEDVFVSVDKNYGFAMSGEDGSVMWEDDIRWPPGIREVLGIVAEEGPGSDLDRDGVGDLLIFGALRKSDEPPIRSARFPLMAISSRTGDRFWVAPETPLPDDALHLAKSWEVRVRPWLVQSRDLNGDGLPEVICLYRRRGDQGPGDICLSIFAYRNGVHHWTRVLRSYDPLEVRDTGLIEARFAFADADRDGTEDVLLGIPSGPSLKDPQSDLVVWSGRSGEEIWRRSLSERPSRMYGGEGFYTPVARDLDGDGSMEILVQDYVPESSERIFCRVTAYDSSTSDVVWEWQDSQWFLGQDMIHPNGGAPGTVAVPLVGDFAESDGLEVAVNIPYIRPKWAALDAQGRLLQESEVDPARQAELPLLLAHDCDGDGLDELLFSLQGTITAARVGRPTPLWEVDLGGEAASMIRVLGSEGAVVGVEDRTGYHGLNALDGERSWALPGKHGNSLLLESSSPGFVRRLDADSGGMIRCRSSYGSEPKRPKASSPRRREARDPRLARLLPWRFDGRSPLDAVTIASVLLAGFSLPLIVLPYRWLWRRGMGPRVVAVASLLFLAVGLWGTRSWWRPFVFDVTRMSAGLGLFLPAVIYVGTAIAWCLMGRFRELILLILAAVVAAAISGGVLLLLDSSLGIGEYYTSEGWERILLLGIYEIGILVWPVRGALRLKRRRAAKAALAKTV